MIPVLVEVELMAMAGFAVGMLFAYLLEIKRRNRW